MKLKKELYSLAGHLYEKSEKFREKTGEVTDTVQQKITLSRLEYNISKKKTELGDLVYEQHCKGEIDQEQIAGLCAEIDELERQRQELKEVHPEEPGCPHCGAVNLPQARFCSGCGYRLGN